MNISPETLIANVEAEMIKVGYSEKAINRHYHYEFNWLLRFMKGRNITRYTQEVGAEALPFMQERRSTFGGKLSCASLIKHIDNFVMQIPMKPPAYKQNLKIGEYYPEFMEYLEWCAQSLSETTLCSRRCYMRRIESGFYNLGLQNLRELDMRIIIDFCETLMDCTPSIKQSTTAALNGFLLYLFDRGYVDRDFSETILRVRYDRKSKIPSYYSQEEIEILLNVIGNETPLQKRNYAMALLAAQTGMRRADVVGLKFESVDWKNNKITFVQQKTGIETTIMLAQGASLKVIADELGHLDIQTTTIYAKIDTPNLEKCALPVPAYREKQKYLVDERLELPIVGLMAPHIVAFILYKRAMGQKATVELTHLRNLSKFSLDYDLSASLLPQQMAEDWLVRRENEKSISQASRTNILRLLAIYLRNLKFDVFVPEPPKRKARSSHFAPHIYSDDELARFFEVADTLSLNVPRVISERKFLIPTLFRVLLGCGLRVTEALNLKISNVNLNAGTLRILEAKYDKDRIVVMDDTLKDAMRNYFNASSALVADKGYVFAKNNGECLTQSNVYEWFRQILAQAGIPHLGRDHGPRIHDFRHTFSVRSLNQMLKEGKSLYNALPILKEYLGHSDIEATEKYIHLVEWMYPEVVAAMNSVSERIIPKLEITI